MSLHSHLGGVPPTTSSKPNHPRKGPSPNAIALEIPASTYELGGGGLHKHLVHSTRYQQKAGGTEPGRAAVNTASQGQAESLVPF